MDADNDGIVDLYQPSSDYPETHGWFFRGTGGGVFADMDKGGTVSGLAEDRVGGLTVGDFDRDGDQDVIMAFSTMRCERQLQVHDPGGPHVREQAGRAWPLAANPTSRQRRWRLQSQRHRRQSHGGERRQGLHAGVERRVRTLRDPKHPDPSTSVWATSATCRKSRLPGPTLPEPSPSGLGSWMPMPSIWWMKPRVTGSNWNPAKNPPR